MQSQFSWQGNNKQKNDRRLNRTIDSAGQPAASPKSAKFRLLAPEKKRLVSHCVMYSLCLFIYLLNYLWKNSLFIYLFIYLSTSSSSLGRWEPVAWRAWSSVVGLRARLQSKSKRRLLQSFVRSLVRLRPKILMGQPHDLLVCQPKCGAFFVRETWGTYNKRSSSEQIIFFVAKETLKFAVWYKLIYIFLFLLAFSAS